MTVKHGRRKKAPATGPADLDRHRGRGATGPDAAVDRGCGLRCTLLHDLGLSTVRVKLLYLPFSVASPDGAP